MIIASDTTASIPTYEQQINTLENERLELKLQLQQVTISIDKISHLIRLFSMNIVVRKKRPNLSEQSTI